MINQVQRPNCGGFNVLREALLPLAPEMNIGFDLAKEYQTALSLHGKKTGE